MRRFRPYSRQIKLLKLNRWLLAGIMLLAACAVCWRVAVMRSYRHGGVCAWPAAEETSTDARVEFSWMQACAEFPNAMYWGVSGACIVCPQTEKPVCEDGVAVCRKRGLFGL